MPNPRPTYALPSNGWRPGDPTQLAAMSGPFHATLRNAEAHAWLGVVEEPMTWPDGWSVRFDPIELVDATGETFAQEGDQLFAAGGHDARGAFALAQIGKVPQ